MIPLEMDHSLNELLQWIEREIRLSSLPPALRGHKSEAQSGLMCLLVDATAEGATLQDRAAFDSAMEPMRIAIVHSNA